MKRLFTFMAVLFVFGEAIAQDHNASSASAAPASDFTSGTNVISLGIGFGGAYSYVESGYSVTPNIILSYDRGLVQAGPGIISIGGLISYKGVSNDYTSPYGYYYDAKWTYLIIGARGAYHYNFTNNPHCDPYAGVMIAYDVLSYSFSSNDPGYNANNPYYNVYNETYPSYLTLSAYIGFRYFVTPNIGFYGELGYGYTIFALGANLKF